MSLFYIIMSKNYVCALNNISWKPFSFASYGSLIFYCTLTNILDKIGIVTQETALLLIITSYQLLPSAEEMFIYVYISVMDTYFESLLLYICSIQ